MMAHSKSNRAGVSRNALFAILAVALVAGLVWYYSASQQNRAFGRNTLIDGVQSGGAPVSDCVSRCKVLLNAGVDLSDGLCVVSDINGYGCAVASDHKSPCDTAGSLPQILLDTSCRFVEVVG